MNRRELPVCGERPDVNNLAMSFDNRAITAVGHAAAHLCGGIHICTVEPDTHILEVRVNGTAVGPCDTVDTTTGTLEIDFLAVDTPTPGNPGHLGSYVLESRWGLNQSRNLLSQPGAAVTVLSGAASGWAAGQTSGNYGTALSAGRCGAGLDGWDVPSDHAARGGVPRAVLLSGVPGGPQAHGRGRAVGARLRLQRRPLEPDAALSGHRRLCATRRCTASSRCRGHDVSSRSRGGALDSGATGGVADQMNFYWLALGVLAVWRVTHLLQGEDGPWDIILRLRRATGAHFIGRILECFYCLSVWVALPLAWIIGQELTGAADALAGSIGRRDPA